jgi:S-adenosylmethionine:diacylglycerol 3-amino-3-carboxypropyl transferase
MSTGTRAAYAGGRFDGRHGQRHVLFGRMYEDSSIELNAFPTGGRIFAIASAGCTTMALSAAHEVVAVDINPVQLAYAGERLRGTPGATGTAERVMGFARHFGSMVGWRHSRLAYFLGLTSPREQSAYWQTHLNTRRFRLSMDALMSLTALRAVYAAAFLDFLPSRLGAVMRGRLERCVGRHSNADNPYLRALLLGEAPADPPAANAATVSLVHADAVEFLERQPGGSFDGFTLSNITDGVDAAYEARLDAAVKHAATPHAIQVRRSFRSGPKESATNRAADDRSPLWGIVDVSAVH